MLPMALLHGIIGFISKLSNWWTKMGSKTFQKLKYWIQQSLNFQPNVQYFFEFDIINVLSSVSKLQKTRTEPLPMFVSSICIFIIYIILCIYFQQKKKERNGHLWVCTSPVFEHSLVFQHGLHKVSTQY